MGTTKLTNGQRYTFGRVNSTPVFDQSDFPEGIEVHRDLTIKGSGYDNAAGDGSGNGDGRILAYPNNGIPSKIMGYNWAAGGTALLELHGPASDVNGVNNCAALGWHAGGGYFTMGLNSTAKVFGLSYSNAYRSNLNCCWQIAGGNKLNMCFGKAGTLSDSYFYTYAGYSGKSSTKDNHPYFMARYNMHYSGTENDGNGIRMRIYQDGDGVSTSRKWFLFENDKSDATNYTYIQGQINGLGSNTRGVSYGSSSDGRLKEKIVDTKFTIDDIMKLKVRDYYWKGGSKLDNGFIAQELNTVYPKAVTAIEGDDGTGELNFESPWQVDYGKITPLIVKGVQDQQRIIEKQQKLIESLEARIQQLEDK